LLLDGWALQSLAHLGGLADPERGAADDVVLRVDRFVRANLAERLDNDLLAALAGFSRRHFIRAFTERGGTTPMRYVHRVRLEEARVLLNDTDLPVAAIAARCGFSHAQHLSTSFRRDTGLTPSQFRSHASR
jgi:AraC family transcriptional regulator